MPADRLLERLDVAGAQASRLLSDEDKAAIEADRAELAELKRTLDGQEITTTGRAAAPAEPALLAAVRCGRGRRLVCSLARLVVPGDHLVLPGSESALIGAIKETLRRPSRDAV